MDLSHIFLFFTSAVLAPWNDNAYSKLSKTKTCANLTAPVLIKYLPIVRKIWPTNSHRKVWRGKRETKKPSKNRLWPVLLFCP